MGSNDVGSAIRAFGFVVVMGAYFNLLCAWVLMLALGAAHDQWAQMPPLGYMTTYLLLAATGCIAAALRTGK